MDVLKKALNAHRDTLVYQNPTHPQTAIQYTILHLTLKFIMSLPYVFTLVFFSPTSNKINMRFYILNTEQDLQCILLTMVWSFLPRNADVRPAWSSAVRPSVHSVLGVPLSMTSRVSIHFTSSVLTNPPHSSPLLFFGQIIPFEENQFGFCE